MPTSSLAFRIGSFGNLADVNELRPDELGFDLRFPIFEEHRQNFAKVRVQLIKRFGLRVRAGKAGDEADEEAGFGRPFDYRGVGLHVEETNTCGRCGRFSITSSAQRLSVQRLWAARQSMALATP